MIETIRERVAALDEPHQQIFARIFELSIATGQAIPPPSMEAWVARQFGTVAAVREQTIVKITNRLTMENALFNPLRARRPTHSSGGDAALEAWIARELAENDIFRDVERDTTADVFGRIYGQHCRTASNVAKYDGWHGLVIFEEPHPLHFSAAQLRDYLDTALRWLAAAHAHAAQAIYPIITWNCLPKSGATLMHGHMQIALASGQPYPRVEIWRRAAALYRATTGADYYHDLAALHAALGLGLPSAGAARAFAHLTPVRNREIVVLAEPAAPQAEQAPGAPPFSLSVDFTDTLFALLRAMIDQHGLRAFNMAIVLPPLAPTAEDWGATPIIARLAERGDPLSNRNDLGAMELFAANVITADPFEVAARLRGDR